MTFVIAAQHDLELYTAIRNKQKEINLHGVDGEHKADKREENRNGTEPAELNPVVIYPCVGEVEGSGGDPHEDEKEHVIQRGVRVLGDTLSLLVVDDDCCCYEAENCQIDEKHGKAEVVLCHRAPALSAKCRIDLGVYLYPFILWRAQTLIDGTGYQRVVFMGQEAKATGEPVLCCRFIAELSEVVHFTINQ